MRNILSVIVLLLFIPVASQAEVGPDQLVKENTQKILGLLKKNKKAYDQYHYRVIYVYRPGQ